MNYIIRKFIIAALFSSSLLLAFQSKKEIKSNLMWQYENQGMSSYEPTYFHLYEQSDTSDVHAEFMTSIRYPAFTWPLNPINRNLSRGLFIRSDFIYTGKYDFFAYDKEERASGPIFSRLQNPGLLLTFYRVYDPFMKTRQFKFNRLFVGVFHESNGQTIEAGDFDTLTNTAFGEDYVSMGWDYINAGFAMTYSINRDKVQKNFFTKTLFPLEKIDLAFEYQYITPVVQEKQELLVWYDDNQDIRDYKGYKASMLWAFDDVELGSLSISSDTTIRFIIQAGANGFKNPTVEGRFTTAILNTLPLTLSVQQGYLSELSYFHKKTMDIAVGLELVRD